MLVEEEGGTQGRLVLATGDNNIYIFDLETRRLVSRPAAASNLTATASSSATVHIVTATA